MIKTQLKMVLFKGFLPQFTSLYIGDVHQVLFLESYYFEKDDNVLIWFPHGVTITIKFLLLTVHVTTM